LSIVGAAVTVRARFAGKDPCESALERRRSSL
jgi:hypothetical protein